ncbi:zf-HC2 domain-containing protein [Solibacillus sp. CAU 1738]|uniref:zf-HC2 domain-containing protein n=1 Tax=Solibacillus sp. CAU 1738 TaxID=3140363 RepID=UPI003260E09F
MTECKIVEDLLPLFEENLLQEETTKWVNEHLAHCSTCRTKTNIELTEIPKPIPRKTAATMIKNVHIKLTIYQLLFVLLSFAFAMSTSIFTGSFQFILSYFVLGICTFYFYRNWILTICIAIIPIFIWTIYDTIASFGSYNNWYLQQMEYYDSIFSLFGSLIGGGLLMGLIHTIFTILGVIVVVLVTKSFEKEDTL